MKERAIDFAVGAATLICYGGIIIGFHLAYFHYFGEVLK